MAPDSCLHNASIVGHGFSNLRMCGRLLRLDVLVPPPDIQCLYTIEPCLMQVLEGGGNGGIAHPALLKDHVTSPAGNIQLMSCCLLHQKHALTGASPI